MPGFNTVDQMKYRSSPDIQPYSGGWCEKTQRLLNFCHFHIYCLKIVEISNFTLRYDFSDLDKKKLAWNRLALVVPSLIMSNKNQNTNVMQCDTGHNDHFGGDYFNFDSLIHVHWWVLVARLRVVQSLWNNYYLTRSFNSRMYGTNMGIKFRWSSINCFQLTCILKTKECIERNQWKRPAANQWAVAKHGQKFS